MSSPNIFEVSPNLTGKYQRIGDKGYALILDEFYRFPRKVRELALTNQYKESKDHYPGSHSDLSDREEVSELNRIVLGIVNSHLLPRLNITLNGSPVTEFRRVRTDFSVVELRPEKLSRVQLHPHTDPVPVFGILYLSCPDQGGTLFFDEISEHFDPEQKRYFSGDGLGWKQIHKIDGYFNRLSLYPGLIPHTGEILTNWEMEYLAVENLRLTQRFMFF